MPENKIHLKNRRNLITLTIGQRPTRSPQAHLLETFQKMAERSGKKSIEATRDSIDREIRAVLPNDHPDKQEAHQTCTGSS